LARGQAIGLTIGLHFARANLITPPPYKRPRMEKDVVSAEQSAIKKLPLNIANLKLAQKKEWVRKLSRVQ
jgi:hypothetical protein